MTITRTRWTDEEIENLVYMHKKGMEKEFIARVLGRTDKAVHAMLYRLGHTAATQEPEQLTLEPTPSLPPFPVQVEAKKEEKPQLVVKKREVYVLVRQAKPSWFERLRCYLNGTKWEAVDKVVGKHG